MANDPSTPKSPRGKPDGALGGIVQAERMLQIAFVLPTAVVVGLFFGYLLDKWLHQSWIEIAGLLVGCVAGFVEIFRLVRQASKDSE